MIISAQKGLACIFHVFAGAAALKEPSSLWDLKEIGCKSVWPVHISLLFRLQVKHR
jgi:hypothetical protein